MNNFNVFQLAEIAYNAYGINCHFRTFDDRLMPVWSELPNNIKDNWVASITVVAMTMSNGIKEIIIDENR